MPTTPAPEALLNPNTQLLPLFLSVALTPVGTPTLHHRCHTSKGLLIDDQHNSSSSAEMCS
jgi:hypothetical protein